MTTGTAVAEQAGTVNGATAVHTFWDTTIGKKMVMAVTGVILVAFVIGHMLGNLKVFTGEEHFNAYAAFLRTMGAPMLPHEAGLWIARFVLLIAVALHIVSATQLTLRSWAARPVAYAVKKSVASTYAARTMRWSGVIVLLFVIYHLLHFTAGVVGYAPGQFTPSVYRNVIVGFSVWWVSVAYIVAMIALGLHLYHGVWSMFQTVGLSGIGADRVYRGVAVVITLAVVLGNIAIPIAVMAGWVR
jgi:succinate dehydrogenase cytochrome b subunit